MSVHLGKNLDGYVRWGDTIKAVLYNGQIIAINETTNIFTFFDGEQTQAILEVLSKHSSDLSEEELVSCRDLASNNLICFGTTASDTNFQDQMSSKGVFECNWVNGDRRAALSSFNARFFFKALYYLLCAKRNSSKGHLDRLLKSLRESYPTEPVTNSEELKLIAHNVNLAIKFCWRKVKCLEFSYAIAMIAFTHRIRCQFVIGVQTYPFISHAWVEDAKGVVFDRQELPNELAKIISIGKTNNA